MLLCIQPHLQASSNDKEYGSHAVMLHKAMSSGNNGVCK